MIFTVFARDEAGHSRYVGQVSIDPKKIPADKLGHIAFSTAMIQLDLDGEAYVRTYRAEDPDIRYPTKGHLHTSEHTAF